MQNYWSNKRKVWTKKSYESCTHGWACGCGNNNGKILCNLCGGYNIKPSHPHHLPPPSNSPCSHNTSYTLCWLHRNSHSKLRRPENNVLWSYVLSMVSFAANVFVSLKQKWRFFRVRLLIIFIQLPPKRILAFSLYKISFLFNNTVRYAFLLSLFCSYRLLLRKCVRWSQVVLWSHNLLCDQRMEKIKINVIFANC